MKLAQLIQEKIFRPYSYRFEKNRKDYFIKYFKPTQEDKILDFGGYDGRRMVEIFSDWRMNIYIADISFQGLGFAKNNYGFETILLNENGIIPYEDKFFDIIFCNSVIEHVTVDKKDMYSIITNSEFRIKSLLRQKKLADEIRRVGKKYFVQTPNKHFIIESHAWFPSFYIYLPRMYQIKLIRFLNRFWIKKTGPDFNLLTVKDMKGFFPDAIIKKEKSLFMTKSIIAIKV